jgi:hypothetical protein
MNKITSIHVNTYKLKALHMKQSAIFVLLLFFCFALSAQNNGCTVQADSLKGTYEGGCSGGKANGTGKAVGADSYEGNFKNGYPDGQGTYTWKNGNFFTGTWKKGLKEGKGEMHFKKAIGDSVVTGFWKKDVYSGRYEKPYLIKNATTDIGRVEVSKSKSSRATIQIEVQNMSGGTNVVSTSPTEDKRAAASTLSGSISLTDVRILTGSYNTKAVNKLTNKEITILQSVTFPFHAAFVFGNTILEMEFFEEGEWTVFVPVQN